MSQILERLKNKESVVIRQNSPDRIELISTDKLKFSNKRVRQRIDREDIAGMAQNIKTFGILQPLEINEKNEVILGTRRLEAAKLASLDKLPVIRRESSELFEIEKQLASDLHSKNLCVIEKAFAFQKLMELKDMTKYALAKYLNISHNLMCRTLAILEANAQTVLLMKKGEISQRMVAMVIYRLKDKNLENFVVNEIVSKRMSIVQAENFLSEVNDPELFKEHFLTRVKAFKTTLEHFKEKLRLLNLTDRQRNEITEELNSINFREIF